jgi:hypothetical protein
MARVAGGAIANRPVTVGFSYVVALFATARHRGAAFELHKWVRGTSSPARLICLREIHLFGSETFLAVNSSPCGRRVSAAQELLVNGFVAAPAIPGCELGGDHETMMIFLLLILRRLVTLETIHALSSMSAHLIFVNHRILCAFVALRAFARGAD